MCGRFTVATDPAVLAERFEVELPEDWAPSYNVAPTQEVLGIVRARDARRQLRELRFGLIPHWAKDMKVGFSMINARAETVRSKGAYSGLLERRRALIVADGFYEWRTDPTAASGRCTTPSRPASPSRSRGCGRAGATRRRTRGSTRAPSSRRPRTGSSRRCTIACR